ncbi:hypothetical protein RclHR1_14070005 [Rhizophagus clarus]|uniref:Uncharacterized protein n=1 Tax=Rhizophagus clarus TaxID=94130 RepID=A0A2Z6R499_9GLOM|nr:hypothetical protein RclHR1_14070005 [Rhizophagus clarus]
MIKVIWIASLNVVQVEQYNNFSDYTHSLLEVNRIKRPKAIRALVEIEASKNYSPPAITSAIKEYAISKLGLGECARELKRKKVANIKYKVCEPTESDLLGNSDLKLNILESVSYLTEQGNIRLQQHNFQVTSSHYAYLSAIDPSVHDVTSPLEHIILYLALLFSGKRYINNEQGYDNVRSEYVYQVP